MNLKRVCLFSRSWSDIVRQCALTRVNWYVTQMTQRNVYWNHGRLLTFPSESPIVKYLRTCENPSNSVYLFTLAAVRWLMTFVFLFAGKRGSGLQVHLAGLPWNQSNRHAYWRTCAAVTSGVSWYPRYKAFRVCKRRYPTLHKLEHNPQCQNESHSMKEAVDI